MKRFRFQGLALISILAASVVGCSSSGGGGGGPRCGDGHVDPGEACDDGNTKSGDGCSSTCQDESANACGNGHLDTGEECDDGNTAAGDGCSPHCRIEHAPATCGNGMMEFGEACDDGNMSNTDDCLNTCVAARCGDGNVHAGVEECDNGPANSDTLANACRTTCKLPKCGDGVKDSPTEECDDGNNVSNDGCSATCVREPRCGDGVKDPGEECDDGNKVNGDGCDMSCHKEPKCGDGVVDKPTEQCDDGNTTANDGCSATCQYESGHFFETEMNNTFSMANAIGTLAPTGIIVHGALQPAGDDDFFSFAVPTTSDLRLETFDGMGPGHCDAFIDSHIELLGTDGTTVLASDDYNGLNSSCSLIDPTDPIYNGATRIAPGTYFAHVRYYSTSFPTAVAAYQLQMLYTARCGNHILEGSETCDDGNTANGDGCGANCLIEPVCGNGVIEPPEECDDHNLTNNDGCNSNCRFEEVLEVEPNNLTSQPQAVGRPDKYIRGAISPADDSDVYQFTLTAPSDVRLMTSDGTSPTTCVGIDTVVELRAADGTVLATNDDSADTSMHLCSLIDPVTEPKARALPAGTYFARVTSHNLATVIATYHLAIRVTAQCGNGKIEGSEMCDDGNLVNGDACTATCQLPPTLETEPNQFGTATAGTSNTGNDFGTALASYSNGPYTSSVYLKGAITPAGDEDLYAIRNPTTGPLKVHFETFGPDGVGTCNFGTPLTSVDTYLNIRDASGAKLAGDDDSGIDYCSMLDYTIPAMTTVYAHVLYYDDSKAIPNYFLFVKFP